MFKYSCSDHMKHGLTKKYSWYQIDAKWHWIHEQGKWNYTEYTAIATYLVNTVFYSKKRLKEVPVNGILLPVRLFKEEEIEQN